MSESETVCIATFDNREEAGWAKSLLEENGIQAMVSADDTGGMYPGVIFSPHGVQLFVLRENAKEAQLILRQADESYGD